VIDFLFLSLESILFFSFFPFSSFVRLFLVFSERKPRRAGGEETKEEEKTFRHQKTAPKRFSF